MTRPLTLAQFADQGAEREEGLVALKFEGALPPQVIDNLRRLRRLDLLTDEVVLALLGQAPIDPLGVFGALKHRGVWAFQPLDFTVVQVLARKGAQPVAVMRIDLISDDMVFVALKDGQLVERSHITRDQLEAKLRERGTTEDGILAWLQEFINDTVAAGLGGSVGIARGGDVPLSECHA